MTEPRSNRRTLEAASVSGDRLINPQGEDLGMIHELLIDPEIGVVVYAVVSFHGVLGLDSKLFVVPYQALKPMADRHRFVFDLDNVDLLGELAPDLTVPLELDGWTWASNGSEIFGFRSEWN